jgi:hypothetical protein
MQTTGMLSSRTRIGEPLVIGELVIEDVALPKEQ